MTEPLKDSLTDIFAAARPVAMPSTVERTCVKCAAVWQADAYAEHMHPTPAICDACAEAARALARLRPALASIPRRYDWASFAAEALRTRCGAPNVSRAMSSRESPRVALLGAPGAGKTSLAVAMLRSVIENPPPGVNPSTCRFVSAYTLNKARGQHPLGQGEAPLVKAAIEADVLVLDDLGSEIDRFGTAVAEVLHERHDDERITWVTTWMSPQQAAERYHGGTARRLFENAEVIRLGKAAA